MGLYLGGLVPIAAIVTAAVRDDESQLEYVRVVRQMMAYTLHGIDSSALSMPDWTRDRARQLTPTRDYVFRVLRRWVMITVGLLILAALAGVWAPGLWSNWVTTVLMGALAIAAVPALCFASVFIECIAWRNERGGFDTAPGTYSFLCMMGGLLALVPALRFLLKLNVWIGVGLLGVSAVGAWLLSLWIIRGYYAICYREQRGMGGIG